MSSYTPSRRGSEVIEAREYNRGHGQIVEIPQYYCNIEFVIQS